ncbi:MAG: N-acetylmuramoyl-L-alanine amidase [Thermodesulfovibrio sp.]|nr:N-acetylmuramoyl-L-alanine amidase [Thermodesulfovibrio sp.]
MNFLKIFLIFFLIYSHSICLAQEELKKITLKVGKHKEFYRLVLHCDEEHTKDSLNVIALKNNKVKISLPEEFNIEFQNKTLTEGEFIKEFYIKKFNKYYLINTPQFKDYKIYKLYSPHRVVIDIYTNQLITTDIPSDKKALSIIIDAGHGGKDVGISYQNMTEKDLTLFIAKEISAKLTKKGINSLLTRDSDIELSIKERLKIGKNQKTGIFLSIHISNMEIFRIYSNYEKIQRGTKNNRLLEQFLNILKNKIEKNYSESISIEKLRVYKIKSFNLPFVMIEIPKKSLLNDNKYLSKIIENLFESINELISLKSDT